MKILMINSVCGIRSTGRICTDLAREFEAKGDEVKIAYGREEVPDQYKKYAVRIGNSFDVKFHGLRTRLLDEHGLGSRGATKRFLRWAEEYNPNILWLHNIHGYYINYELLFDWIKKRSEMEVRWTLHDCWAFTGHCSHFTVARCEQWKSHCMHCIQKTRYPESLFIDNSKCNFDRKRAAFTGVKNLTLITPSQWLANLVKLGFLREYPVEVHYNTINTNVFKPTASNFREQYELTDKRIILGVASTWSERKGLNDFMKLAEMLDDNYRIVLVGLDIKKMTALPKNVIGIARTNSADDLAKIYTAADVFVNPTYEDNYPTVNLEAEACGTRVITYDTGGCKEGIKREDSVVVAVGDIEAIKRECCK